MAPRNRRAGPPPRNPARQLTTSGSSVAGGGDSGSAVVIPLAAFRQLRARSEQCWRCGVPYSATTRDTLRLCWELSQGGLSSGLAPTGTGW